jgi:Ca2+-binding EF-hand superfamily protein
MEGDINANEKGSSHQENVHIDLSTISSNVCAIFILVDGGQRNFQHVQRVVLSCSQENLERDQSNFMNKVDPSLFSTLVLFQCVNRSKKDFEGIAHSVLYRDGWDDDRNPIWIFKCIYEPLYTKSMKEKDDICNNLAISTVPSLELYKPRLFPNVKSLSSALSSNALPSLKEKFQASGGLDSFQFTDTLFRSLCEFQPKLLNLSEAASTIAALQDMFSQIDFNGDGTVDWDEFTTFCIQMGLTSNDAKGYNNENVLDKYVVEYREDGTTQDNVIKSHSQLSIMKYIQPLNRIVAMLEKGDSVLMMNEHFKLHSIFDPSRLPHSDPQEKPKIYDICYLPSKDLFAYSASDHSIVILKEQTSLNGKRISYSVQKKILTNTLHLKLCWSDRCKILCSVSSDNVVYGWDTDEQNPIFQVSRHKDTITDFISIDPMELFVTCSLDKRIVLWSQSSRRVRGVLLGHKRGIRFMSYLRGALLSAGFECEAKTWDVSLREPTLILRGHRAPIAAGKVMCPEGESLESLRAITVDDSGEFRLWNIYVKEKGSDPTLAPVLQTFSVQNSQTRFSFLELPFNPHKSIGAYSNIIAGASKLIHFVPEKNTAEFVPPKSICYSEPNNCLVTAIGHHLFKYDIFTGSFSASHLEITNSDVTSMCLDEYYGRRLYLGCANGRLLLINFATAAIIDSIVVHSKDILAIAVIKSPNHNMVFTGSLDGRIRYLEESSGVLTLHTTADQPIGDNCGIAIIQSVPSLKVLAVASAGLYWGLYYALTFKRICLIEETTIISSIEILSSSGDSADIDEHNLLGLPLSLRHLVSLAVCSSGSIKIYTIDTLHCKIAMTHTLTHTPSLYLSEMRFFPLPSKGSINYTPALDNIPSKYSDLLIASSDEGFVILWDASQIRKETKSKFYSQYPALAEGKRRPLASSQRRNHGVLETDNILTDPQEDRLPPHREGSEENENDEGGYGFDEDEDDAASDQSLGVKLSCLSPAQAKKRRIATFTKSQRSMSQFILETQNTQIMGLESVTTMSSIRAYRFHSDVICAIAPLLEHGCLITCSLDGYQRIINMDGECLGEMPLPNITEKMKERSLHIHWKFLLEKLPIKESHCDIATKLLKSILDGQRIRHGGQARRNGQITLNHTTSFGEKLVRKAMATSDEEDSLEFLYRSVGKSEKTEKMIKEINDERLRKSILKAVKNPYQPSQEIAGGSLAGGGVGGESASRATDIRKASVSQVHSIWDQQPDSVLSRGNSLATPLPLSEPFSKPSSPQLPSLSSSSTAGQLSLEGEDRSITSRSQFSRKSTRSRKASPSLSPWSKIESLVPHCEPFSEHSIASSHQQGLIDAEGHHILRKVNHDRERKEIFSRPIPQVLLKDVQMSCSVEVPALGEMLSSEILFGDQKEMYKNANVLYSEKKLSMHQAQHTISLSRIKQNLRRIGPMVQLIPALPLEIGELQQPNAMAQVENSCQSIPLLGLDEENHHPSKVYAFDQNKISLLMKKVEEAGQSIPHWEKDRDLVSPSRKKSLHRTVSSIRTNVDVLEKKLLLTVRSFFRNQSLSPGADMKILNTRSLLPYYKLADVKHFLDAFQKVDEDYSGDLDIEEWCQFLTSFNKSLSKQHCRTIFNRVDRKGEGVLSVRELIPVVFSQANKDQQALITKYLEIEISKRKASSKDLINETDLRKLFDYYDEESLGFISVDFFREKIKFLQLPDAATESLLGKIQTMDPDEMLNPSDFVRIFHQYVVS